MQHPAPVGHPNQQNPDRLAERAGEVRDRNIDRDDEVERIDGRRGIGKIPEGVSPHPIIRRALPGEKVRLRAAAGISRKGQPHRKFYRNAKLQKFCRINRMVGISAIWEVRSRSDSRMPRHSGLPAP
jgi:hypothetical protein